MQITPKTSFLLLAISQAFHSLEEYYFSLWEVFGPARFVSALVSDNLPLGFSIINISFVLFGFWCYFYPVCQSWKASKQIMWFWVILELGNSIGHAIVAFNTGGYFPGIYTAPFMFVCASYLAIQLVNDN